MPLLLYGVGLAWSPWCLLRLVQTGIIHYGLVLEIVGLLRILVILILVSGRGSWGSWNGSQRSPKRTRLRCWLRAAVLLRRLSFLKWWFLSVMRRINCCCWCLSWRLPWYKTTCGQKKNSFGNGGVGKSIYPRKVALIKWRRSVKTLHYAVLKSFRFQRGSFHPNGARLGCSII